MAVGLTSALLQQLLFCILQPFTSAKGFTKGLAGPAPSPGITPALTGRWLGRLQQQGGY